MQGNATGCKAPLEARQEGRSGALLGLYPKSRGLNEAAFSGLASKRGLAWRGLVGTARLRIMTGGGDRIVGVEKCGCRETTQWRGEVGRSGEGRARGTGVN